MSGSGSRPSAGPSTSGDGNTRATAETNAAVRGKVRVAPAVLIELIELTVRDIAGVTGFQSRKRMERILPPHQESPAGASGGRVIEAGGIRVHLAGDEIEVDISITAGPDVSLVDTSREIRRQVGTAVSRMLGLNVLAVNVFITGIRSDSEG